MKKLPVKWNLFLVFNYLQLACSSFILIALVGSFIKGISNGPGSLSGPDSLYYILVALGVLLICLNSFLNTSAVHRYFPDTLIPQRFKMFMKTTGIINIILFAGLLCLFFYGLTEELSAEYEPHHVKIGIYVLIICFFLLASGIYTLILQFSIFRFLRRNNAIKMSLLINSIGNQ